ncbi:tRNA (guanine-N7-)-methyltransferase subunit Trm82 [Pyrenophora tritici-repentis Pt-1C-BFP]|uniref:tRNA (Guanine-N7-)-methyltransferase subunit Trm82 n=1 Tax=Pyrenophora tritici-repentis (strain Pt-1C-BFP) TaxID=426418 RepID=B2WCC2_PYRTR|nr:tRNA (guanine-N7-)-methyltransferase subunit Trm82 [Pyrenophora tritici-repentis Pt-1C-BFP]EDU50550.1 tRNA (guanine-N7-)-methyltransferase subunit Trm82 [Pyrenophora tritici-repentis Pt-1C-BFP]
MENVQENYLVGITGEDKCVRVFQIDSQNSLQQLSERNRKTLEEQLKQKAKGLAKSKEPMRFKHQLLLGHVSMLTDVVYAKVNGRSYIITADRDEHIRISRGLPQAHIIEGFCFGHEAFISKLCLTPSGLLVSGGGDDHLYVDEILVACEGVPALFHFKMGDAHANHIPLAGNALDVAMIQTPISPMCLIISIDNIHKAGSTTEVRDDKVPRLQYFSRQADGEWVEDAHIATALSGFAHGKEADSNGLDAGESVVRSMLYNVENLRKRPGADD